MSIYKNGKLIAGLSISYHPDLFDWKWADHKLNDVQWLRADTFSWQSSTVYQAAYQHLVDDYNNTGEHLYGWSTDTFSKTPYPSVGDVLYRSDGTEWSTVAFVANDYSYIIRSDGVAQLNRNTSIDTVLYETYTETIAGVTITYYQAADGHKLVLPDQESNVAAIYTATGVAWYYIIDTVNQRFKLPRAKHNKYTTLLSVIGTGKTLGLTSNGSNMYALGGLGTAGLGGYFQTFSNNTTPGSTSGAATRDTGSLGVSKDPTLSGLTTTSMEQDTDQYKYLYFYVGAFTQPALENTAGITTEEMNDKLDMDLGNASSVTKQEIAALCFPDFTSPTRTGLSLNTSYQAESNGYVKISASTGGDIYSLTRVSIQVSNDNSTFSVVAANAAYSTGGQHVLIAPVRRGQYFKGTGSSGSMEFFSI